MSTKQKNIRLDRELCQWYDELGKANERDSSFYIRKALEKYRGEYGQEVKPVAAVSPKAAVKTPAVDFSVFAMTSDQLAEVKRIRVKNKGGAITTQRVANGLAKEISAAVSAGMTIDEILTEWETRGWKSIKADWLLKDRGNSSQGFSARVSELAASRGEAPRGFDAAKPVAGTVIDQGGLELGHD